MIKVEVCYALPEQQKIITLDVPTGTTPMQAAQQSNIVSYFPGLILETSDMGIFGKAVDANNYALHEGDRVEIYRPLIADPKEVRKARAAKAKQA
jgi:putative ubiquitin-RnfH superfamily antitoxin RatB of RatAB toxin-antitoxin module